MVAFLLVAVVILATISNVVDSEPCCTALPRRLRYRTREASIQQNKSVRRLRKDLEIHKKQVHPRPPLLDFSHDNNAEEDSVSMFAQDVAKSMNTHDKTDEVEESVSMSMLTVSNYMIENTLANDDYIISMSIVLDIERDVIPTRVQFTRRHMDWEEEPI